jgi:hypothetical protein
VHHSAAGSTEVHALPKQHTRVQHKGAYLPNVLRLTVSQTPHTYTPNKKNTKDHNKEHQGMLLC